MRRATRPCIDGLKGNAGSGGRGGSRSSPVDTQEVIPNGNTNDEAKDDGQNDESRSVSRRPEQALHSVCFVHLAKCFQTSTGISILPIPDLAAIAYSAGHIDPGGNVTSVVRERRFQTIATAVVASVVDLLSSFLNPRSRMGVDCILGNFALDTLHNEVR